MQVRCNGAGRSTARPVEIDIPSGGAVACTFINAFVAKGSISLAKITEGGTGTASFLVFPVHGSAAQYLQSATTTTPGVAAGAVPDSAADATDHLPLGAYWIVEQPPAGGPAGGWALTAVNCDGLLVPFAQGAAEVELTHAHPSVHCVYTDTFSATPPPPPPPVNPPPVAPPPAPVFPVVPGQPAYQLSDLVVTKHASASIVTRGDVVGYRITVKNLGPNPAQRVVLGDQPLGHAPIVSVHPSAGHCQGAAADRAPDHLRTRHAATRRQDHGDATPAGRDRPRPSSQTQQSPAPRRRNKRSPTTSPARASPSADRQHPPPRLP